MAYRKRLLLGYDSSYGTPPIIDADFTSGVIPSNFIFSRTSAAYGFVGGTLTSFSSNIPRSGLDQGAGILLENDSTNYVTNPRGEGAAAPALPTNWNVPNAGTSAQISYTKVGNGTENGIPYTDIRIQGTWASGNVRFAFENIAVCPYTVNSGVNMIASCSAYIKQVGGTLTGNLGAISIGFMGYTAALAATGGPVFNAFTLAISGALKDCRVATIGTALAPSTNAWIRPAISWAVTAGAVDITLRIGAPQLEVGLQNPSSPMLPVVGTPATTTRAGDFLYVVERLNAPTATWFNPNAGALVAEFIHMLPGGSGNGRGMTAVLHNGATDIIANMVIGSPTNPAGCGIIVGGVYQMVSGVTTLPAALGSVMRNVFNFSLYVRQNTINGIYGNTGYTGEVGYKPLPVVTELALSNPTAFPTSIGAQGLSMQMQPHILRKFEYYPRLLSPEEALLSSIPVPDNYPPGASLGYDFTASPSLDPSISFTRASVGTYFDISGALQTASSGTPRFDYDPVTHAARGLLIEEARTNVLLNSAALGTQSVTVTAQQYTLSFYGTGTITKSGTATGALVGTGVFPQRVSQTFTPTAGTLTLTVTGSVQNAQLEAGAFPTSYIPTTAAAVTRNADIATTNVTPWINTAAGSLVVELMLPQVLSTGTNIAIAALDSGAATNTIEARQQGLSTQPAVSVFIANALVGGASGINNFTPSVVNKIAFNYNSAPLAITCALNGVIGAVLGTPTSLPTISRMTIGSGRNSLINGYVRKIKYWPRAVSDIELQAATT